ncbi:hypothetical protein HDV00_001754 [Rhizophlyctis rosea]|nr:hypothetical protein HDV00_001754 [Rhizophlyctis rosea]
MDLPATPPPSPNSTVDFLKYEISTRPFAEPEHRLLTPPPEVQMRRLGKRLNLPAELLLHVFSFIKTKSELRPLSEVSFVWHNCVSKVLFRSVKFSSITSYRSFIDALSVEKRLTEGKGTDHAGRNAAGKRNCLCASPTSCGKCLWEWRPSFSCPTTSPHRLGLIGGLIQSIDLTGYSEPRQLEPTQYFNRSSEFFGHRSVTDAHISLIASTCPNLTAINLSHCRRLTDLSVIKLIRSATLLRSVTLTGTEITDATLSVIAAAPCATSLTHLNLSQCHHLNDIALQFLVRSLPFLHHVNLSSLWRVSELVVKALVISCPQLCSLIVSDCRFTGQTIFAHLAKYANNLERLDISFCAGLLSEEMERYIRFSKRLKCCTYTSVQGKVVEVVHRVCARACL